MGKMTALWICALAAVSALPHDSVTRQLGGMRGVVIGAASREFAKNGEGSSILLKDGTLLHLFSRHIRPLQNPEKYENSDLWPAIIAATRSTDKGLTWSEPEVLFRSSTGENVMQPSLARLANGEIGVSYSRIDSYSAATKVFRWSGDEGRTWSEEVLISPSGGYWTSAHDRMIVLASGRVLLPLHHKKSVRPEHMVTQVAYSDDNGRSWKLAPQQLDVVDVIPEFAKRRPGARGFWEASIAPLADGSLFMLGRTYGGWLYQARSRDEGLTWDQPRPSRLMSSAAPGRVERIPGTDNLLVVWNSCCLNEADGLLGPRLTLSSAISTDNGETWKWQREIESVAPGRGHRVEYPAISIYDGQVYLTYRAQAGLGAGEMQMQQYLSILPVSWFTAAGDQHRPWLAFFREQAAIFDTQRISSAIDSLPSNPPTNSVIIDQRGHAVKVARVHKRNGPFEVQEDEERVFYILKGRGTLRLGSGAAQREEKMLPGTVISVPRGMAYQIIASDSDVSFLVVAIR